MIDVQAELATFRSRLRDMLVGHGIPAHMHEGITEYLARGRPTGDFLRTVLSNDLRFALRYADDENRPLLRTYVQLFYLVAPTPSWGSARAYEQWVKGHGLVGVWTRANDAEELRAAEEAARNDPATRAWDGEDAATAMRRIEGGE